MSLLTFAQNAIWHILQESVLLTGKFLVGRKGLILDKYNILLEKS